MDKSITLKKHSSADLLTISKDSAKLRNFSRELTIQEAYKGTPIKELSKSSGEVNVIALITRLIKSASNLYKIKNGLKTDDDFIDAAYALYDRYSYETAEDFVLCFQWAKTGRLTRPKYAFDLNTLIDWMSEYLDKKAEAIENQLKEKEILNKEQQSGLSNEVVNALKESVKSDEPAEQQAKSLNEKTFQKKLQENAKNYKIEELLRFYNSIMNATTDPERIHSKELTIIRNEINKRAHKTFKTGDKNKIKSLSKALIKNNFKNKI